MVYVRLPGATVPAAASERETQGSVARLPADVRVQPGQRLTVAVDTAKLHLFDPDTTNRIA
jgi:hypothetical protein